MTILWDLYHYTHFTNEETGSVELTHLPGLVRSLYSISSDWRWGLGKGVNMFCLAISSGQHTCLRAFHRQVRDPCQTPFWNSVLTMKGYYGLLKWMPRVFLSKKIRNPTQRDLEKLPTVWSQPLSEARKGLFSRVSASQTWGMKPYGQSTQSSQTLHWESLQSQYWETQNIPNGLHLDLLKLEHP
jgi:hypothetical protein